MTELCFDGRFINPHHPDGISRFSLGLIGELKTLCDLTVLVASSAQQEVIGEGVRFLELCEVTSPKEIFTARKLNRAGVQVVFSPMQTTSGLGRKFKLILTLHDLIYYRHRTPPAQFSWPVRLVWFLYHLSYLPQRLLLNAADQVVTVSETTKAEMVRVRLTKRPITVIHNSADSEGVAPGNRHDSHKFVYMGSFIGYKNVETLIRAAGLRPELELVLLSKIQPDRKAELERLALELGANVNFRGGVSPAEYQQELATCRALVSASLDEGFGIPVVEAMAAGTPVVLSDLDIFREVAGGAGNYFNPHDPEQLAAELDRLGNPEIWASASLAGIEQAKRFSWRDSAQRLVNLVQSL